MAASLVGNFIALARSLVKLPLTASSGVKVSRNSPVCGQGELSAQPCTSITYSVLADNGALLDNDAGHRDAGVDVLLRQPEQELAQHRAVAEGGEQGVEIADADDDVLDPHRSRLAIAAPDLVLGLFQPRWRRLRLWDGFSGLGRVSGLPSRLCGLPFAAAGIGALGVLPLAHGAVERRGDKLRRLDHRLPLLVDLLTGLQMRRLLLLAQLVGAQAQRL